MLSVIQEFFEILHGWESGDTKMVLTAAAAAMACALPGNFLLVRRQSMMGDAISHTVLPGIVMAFLITHFLFVGGWISAASLEGSTHAALFLGAMVMGVLCAVLTEWVQKLGHVESSAALGVVFTSLFALGLLLLRLKADDVHLDPDCVLFGTLESVFNAPDQALPNVFGQAIPWPAIANGGVMLLNLALTILFFKELRLCAFDPALATTLGINARIMHYALMAFTAATLVAAFETVGSILVIAMLIAPAATAHLLTDRFSRMIGLSLVLAACSALLGHVMAITLPAIIFSRLGFPTVETAYTAGMMAVASGLLFAVAVLFAPRHGVLSRMAHRFWLALTIAGEDILGLLYRREERETADVNLFKALRSRTGQSRWIPTLALWRLRRSGLVAREKNAYQLTPQGRAAAEDLVRSHRLWESYMAKHFDLPEDHLHASAERVEHFLSPELQDELITELDAPREDPHGSVIPGGPLPSSGESTSTPGSASPKD